LVAHHQICRGVRLEVRRRGIMGKSNAMSRGGSPGAPKIPVAQVANTTQVYAGKGTNCIVNTRVVLVSN